MRNFRQVERIERNYQNVEFKTPKGVIMILQRPRGRKWHAVNMWRAERLDKYCTGALRQGTPWYEM